MHDYLHMTYIFTKKKKRKLREKETWKLISNNKYIMHKINRNQYYLYM